MINLTVYTAVTCTYGSRKPTTIETDDTQALRKLHNRYRTSNIEDSIEARSSNQQAGK